MKVKNRTLIEVYKSGERKVFHRTFKWCYTHPDTTQSRDECEICRELQTRITENPEALPPCQEACVICHPTQESNRASARRASAKRRAKK